MTLRRRAAALAALSMGVAVAACGGGSSNGGDAQPASSGEGATEYPLTLDNCGEEVVFEAAPQRAVTMNQTAAEILIHLGLGDRIVGTGYEVEEVPEEIATEYEAIPMLSAQGQSIRHEALLEAQPDFAYSSFATWFTAAQGGERDVLHDLGMPTYLTEFDCVYHAAVANASFDLLFEEYRNLASIFDVPSAGDRLIAGQQAVIDDGLETAEEIEGTPRVMWFYSTYAGTPWAAGAGGMPQHISELVGVENVFDDATSTKWPEVSWDEVAARNPDVIILADLTRGEPGDTAEEKIELLKNDPLTRQLDAVVNDRFVIMPGGYMEPSYGSAYAVPALAEGLVELQ
jgi:iron complex transport system substrate-binding protein